MKTTTVKIHPVSPWIMAIVAVFALSGAHQVSAAEGGADYYLPGVYGNFGMADLPGPGNYFLNYTIYQSGNIDKATKNGTEHVDMDTKIAATVFAPVKLFDYELLGGHPLIGIGVPLMGYELEASPDTNATQWGMADISLVAGLSWKLDNWTIFAYELVNVPVGEYDVDKTVSLGFNYWAFDTNVSLTYDWPHLPVKLNNNLGYLFSTKNDDTHYQTGDSVHLDTTVEYDMTEKWQLGMSAYYYKQIEGDSGSGATLGGFKGEAFGYGPSIEYVFSMKPLAVLQFIYLHDESTTNRLKDDTGVLMLALEF